VFHSQNRPEGVSMFKSKTIIGALLISTALFFSASCSLPGIERRTFLRLSWTETPRNVSFPSFPSVINRNEYVEHIEGYHQGYYEIGSWAYDADYWITVDDGGPAPELGIGDSGDWHYLTLRLLETGPEIDTDFIETRSPRAMADYTTESAAAEELENGLPGVPSTRTGSNAIDPQVVEREWRQGPLHVRARYRIYALD
jgi:hypothetical protein